jgi:hypothetical protein
MKLGVYQKIVRMVIVVRHDTQEDSRNATAFRYTIDKLTLFAWNSQICETNENIGAGG